MSFCYFKTRWNDQIVRDPVMKLAQICVENWGNYDFDEKKINSWRRFVRFVRLYYLYCCWLSIKNWPSMVFRQLNIACLGIDGGVRTCQKCYVFHKPHILCFKFTYVPHSYRCKWKENTIVCTKSHAAAHPPHTHIEKGFTSHTARTKNGRTMSARCIY